MKAVIFGLVSATVLALGAGTASAQYPVYPAPVYQSPVVVAPPRVIVAPPVVVGGPVVNVGLGGFWGGVYRPYYGGYYHGGYNHGGYYHGGYYHHR